MNTRKPLLKIRFDGPSVGASRIPVVHLVKFLGNLNKALQRTGQILKGAAESTRQGRPSQQIREEIGLDLVLLTEGSPAAVLGLERRQADAFFPHMDFGMEILKNTIIGLGQVQNQPEAAPLPNGYDTGVLMAWRDAGSVFSQGVDHIEISLLHQSEPINVSFNAAGLERIEQRIQLPKNNIRTIEGRLLMADFKEHGTRCRVHPSASEPVLCLFDADQKDEVLGNILEYVRIVGEAKEDPSSGKIASIKIHDMERLEVLEDKAVDLFPHRPPISRSFWDSATLDELAKEQNVGPISSVETLFASWPGEEDDDFEAAIDKLRHQECDRKHRP